MEEDENQKQSLGSQLKEIGKEEVKRRGKQQVAKKILWKIAPWLGGVLLALIALAALVAFVDLIRENWQGIINTITDVFKGPQTAIELNDEQIDELIAAMEATGLDMNDLELLR